MVFRVLEVNDGDTFRIKSGNEERRVRLMGVDAPEMGRCLSSEAKDKLTQLVLGKDVDLENQFRIHMVGLWLMFIQEIFMLIKNCFYLDLAGWIT